MTSALQSAASRTKRAGPPPPEVLRVFLKLGLTSFGGPLARLCHFPNEIVVKRGWLNERAFADLIAVRRIAPLAITPTQTLLFQERIRDTRPGLW
jgi:chromate transporter